MLTFDSTEVADVSKVLKRTSRRETFEMLGANINLDAGTATVVAVADLLPPTDPPLSIERDPIVEIDFDVVDHAVTGRYPLDLTQGSLSNASGTEEFFSS